MNELNTLENRLDNLLDQYEAINIDSNDMGIKELSQMIESLTLLKMLLGIMMKVIVN